VPATRNQLRRPILNTHTVTFGEGVDVTFTFNRNVLTDAWFREWRQLEQQRDADALNVALDGLVHSWDVVNDDGSPYPKSVETFSELFTLPDKARIVEELMTAAVPTRAEGNASENISSTASTDSASLPVSPPNGLAPSPSPTPSASPSPT
jgi:hypothetical protein